MVRTHRIVTLFVIGCLLTVLPACGNMRDAAMRQKTSNDLKQVLLGYHSYLDTNTKPPADEKEFMAWANKLQPEVVAPFGRISGQGYKVYWGTRITGLPAGATNTVLIYPADAAANGGMVGFADGSVRTVSAQEFVAAAKPTEAKK